MALSQAADTIEMGAGEDILARIERLPLSAWQIKTRIIVGTATFFDAFDALAIAYVLPAIRPLWHLTGPQTGILISAGYVGQLIGALAGGLIAERVGRRPVILISTLWFGLISLACGFAWNYESLLVLRLVQGLGLGAEVPIAATYISELSRARGRGAFVLLFELIFPVGLVAAAVLGRWIVPNLGWQYLFFLGGVPALLVLAMMRNLPESPRWLAARGRSRDAEEAMAFIESKVAAAIGRHLPAIVPLSVAPAAKRAEWRELFGATYRARTLVIWTAWFATYFANYGLATWLPTVYQEVFKLSLGEALSYAIATPALGLASSFACALLIDRSGRRIWFTAALAWSAGGFLLLWWIGPSSAQRVMVLTTFSYMGISTLSLALYLYTAELYPTRVRALGTGTATAWLRLASILGPQVFGNARVGTDIGGPFLTFGFVLLAACVVVGLFATETKGRVLEEISP
ncbi:MAG TPA: MFS transporter [Xanthobacteraceae bacterium]|nr:MFS transporter [Xanthobacteraceae bacterium]